MNIAFCISGSKRTFEKLKLNSKMNLFNDSNEIFTVLDEPIDIDTNRDLYFNNQKFYTDKINLFNNNKRPETSIINTLQMFYRIYKCNQLKSEYEKEKNIKFDIVVRLRPDLYYFNKINFNFLNKNEIMTPVDYNWGGICDQFWYSDSNTSNIISDLYFDIPKHIEEGCIFHPETLLLYHCNKNNIKVHQTDNLKFEIIR